MLAATIHGALDSAPGTAPTTHEHCFGSPLQWPALATSTDLVSPSQPTNLVAGPQRAGTKDTDANTCSTTTMGGCLCPMYRRICSMCTQWCGLPLTHHLSICASKNTLSDIPDCLRVSMNFYACRRLSLSFCPHAIIHLHFVSPRSGHEVAVSLQYGPV